MKTKKKGFRCNFGLFGQNLKDLIVLAGALFRLIIQRSNLDGGTLNLDGGDAKSR